MVSEKVREKGEMDEEEYYRLLRISSKMLYSKRSDCLDGLTDTIFRRIPAVLQLPKLPVRQENLSEMMPQSVCGLIQTSQ